MAKKKVSTSGNEVEKVTTGSNAKRNSGKRKSSSRANKSEKTSQSKAHIGNDPSWYAATPQLMKDSASLPYSYATGSKLPMLYDSIEYATRMHSPRSVPGIFRMNTIPSIGIADSAVSPVNIAARKIYAWVRHANSGSVNYDAPDLMVYLLSMDSCYSLFSHLMRAIGFINTYTQKNRYMNEALIELGMGINHEDLRTNIANYRYELNVLASKLASLAVPNTMSYFVRHAWMYQNVYLDAPTEKAQCYLYSPEYLWKFKPVESQTGGMLEATAIFNDDPQNMSVYIGILNDMINAVIVDEDMNIMSGDIIKAYGTDLIQIGTISEDIILAPVFDASVLTQIQNATMIGLPAPESIDVTQGTDGSLLFDPVFVNPGNKQIGKENTFINMPIDGVEPEQTMVATRLTNIPIAGQSASEFKLIHSGSEIVTSAYIIYFGVGGGSLFKAVKSERITSFKTINVSAAGETFEGTVAHVMLFLSQIQQFAMHPGIRLGVFKTGYPGAFYISDFISLDNYTVIDKEVLGRMHETALLSEFDVYGVEIGRAHV